MTYTRYHGVRRRTTVLTDEDIRFLPTVPVSLVPSPGPNKVLILIAAYLFLEGAEGGDYDGLGQVSNLTYIVPSDLSGVVSTSIDQRSAGMWLCGGCTYLASLGPRTGADTSEVYTMPVLDLQDTGFSLATYNEMNDNPGISTNFTGGHPDNKMTVTVTYDVLSF